MTFLVIHICVQMFVAIADAVIIVVVNIKKMLFFSLTKRKQHIVFPHFFLANLIFFFLKFTTELCILNDWKSFIFFHQFDTLFSFKSFSMKKVTKITVGEKTKKKSHLSETMKFSQRNRRCASKNIQGTIWMV